MTPLVDLVIRTSPALAKRLLDNGAADIITRMADGKFDAITKCIVSVLTPNDAPLSNNILNAISIAKYGTNPALGLGIDLLKIAGVVTSTIKMNGISKDVKIILSKVGEICVSLNVVKTISYLNMGIGLVNLGTEIAGIIYIGKRLNDVQKSIGQLSTQIGQLKTMLTNERISYFHRLCLRFGSISVRLRDNDFVDRKEIEELLIDMRAFMSEMIRNIYYDAIDAEIILEMIFTLLSAYVSLLNVFVRDYYFEKGRFQDNIETYSNQLFSELLDDKFIKIVGDYLVVKKGLQISEALSALQTQQLLVTNCMLQHQDNIDLIKLLGTKKDYLTLMNALNQYSEDEMEKLIPIIEKKTGRSDCREVIKKIMRENTLAAC